jgi:hypothetical protein
MIYRKRGSVARWENGTLICVTECGIAIEKDDLFECHPERSEGPGGEGLDLPADPPPSLATRGMTVERLILLDGLAEHQYGDVRWAERTQRLHLAMTNSTERVLIDQADFDTTHIERVAAALQRMKPERDAPKHLRLAKNVTAALVPFLGGIQTAGGKDGYGNDIIDGGESWYRPSYRVRPVKMKLNVRLEHDVTEIDRDLPEAIALLRPVDGLTVRVLMQHGEDVWPAVVRIGKIRGLGREQAFYPYAAGSFGAEMML